MSFIQPQKTLNVNQVKNHKDGTYLWTEKKDGHYLQLHNGHAFTKTGRDLGKFPYGSTLNPLSNYEVEAYGKDLAAAKSALGRKVIPWHVLQYRLHNRIDNSLEYQVINDSLWELQNGILEYAPILITGTIEKAIAYAESKIYPAGGEGLVGRLQGRAGYMSNCRNKTLIKIKSKEYLEAVVVSQTTGSEQVLMKSLTGASFSVKAMNRTIVVGKKYWVECMKINPNGVPREPVLLESGHER